MQGDFRDDAETSLAFLGASSSRCLRPSEYNRNGKLATLSVNDSVTTVHCSGLLQAKSECYTVLGTSQNNKAHISCKCIENFQTNLGFEVLPTVVMKSSVFWDIMPCESQPTFAACFMMVPILAYISTLK
jgi:hypothetical protein